MTKDLNEYVYNKLIDISTNTNIITLNSDYIYYGYPSDYHNFDNNAITYTTTLSNFDYSLDSNYYTEFDLTFKCYSKDYKTTSILYNLIQLEFDNLIDSNAQDFSFQSSDNDFDEITDCHIIQINYKVTYVI